MKHKALLSPCPQTVGPNAIRKGSLPKTPEEHLPIHIHRTPKATGSSEFSNPSSFLRLWKLGSNRHQDLRQSAAPAAQSTLGWVPVEDGALETLRQGNWIPPSCRVQGGSRGAPRTSPSLPQQGVVPCPHPALPSHSHHHFASIPLHRDLPFSSCRGWWRKTPHVTWQRTKGAVFNQTDSALTRTGRCRTASPTGISPAQSWWVC